MSDSALVDLFVEDRAHEQFLHPLLRRLAEEEGVTISVRVRSARGGHPRAIEELRLYQDLIEGRSSGASLPDLLVVGVDGNCTTFAKKRKEIERATREPFRSRLVVACPDPHVERWYVSDPDSFQLVVGQRPAVGRKKCERDYYKRILAMAVRQAGHPATLGGIEFAREIVERLDWYRAGKIEGSLRAFLEDLRAALRRLRAEARGEPR